MNKNQEDPARNNRAAGHQEALLAVRSLGFDRNEPAFKQGSTCLRNIKNSLKVFTGK